MQYIDGSFWRLQYPRVVRYVIEICIQEKNRLIKTVALRLRYKPWQPTTLLDALAASLSYA